MYPAVQMQGGPETAVAELHGWSPAVGFHEVIIESPLHAARMGELPQRSIEDLFRALQERMLAWEADQRVQYVQWFKNSGEAAGASLEHPHSQLMTLPTVPRRVQEELAGAKSHFERAGRCVFCEMLRLESAEGERLVLETEQIEAIAPWAPRFGFETWILPKRHGSDFCKTNPTTLGELACAVHRIMRALDCLLDRPAYNLILHTSPIAAASPRSLSLASGAAAPHRGRRGFRVGHRVPHQRHHARILRAPIARMLVIQ